LVVFGSPEKGVHEIIGGRMNKVQNARSLNFFPDQATETVRLEEALLGTLAIINASK
jgi:methyltransferase